MAEFHYRPDVFEVSNLEEAMKIILTPEDGLTPADRWQRETPPLAKLLADQFDPVPNQTVIDYGCGVGRLAKELIRHRPCNVIGVDISRSMRALSHMYCEAETFFSCSKASLEAMTSDGIRADYAYAVWVLQHAHDPKQDIDLIHAALADGGKFFVLNLEFRCLPTDKGWKNDGLDIRGLLEERFDAAEYLPPPKGAVTDAALSKCFCGIYEKRGGG